MKWADVVCAIEQFPKDNSSGCRDGRESTVMRSCSDGNVPSLIPECKRTLPSPYDYNAVLSLHPCIHYHCSQETACM